MVFSENFTESSSIVTLDFDLSWYRSLRKANLSVDSVIPSINLWMIIIVPLLLLLFHCRYLSQRKCDGIDGLFLLVNYGSEVIVFPQDNECKRNV
jgi:hypothetical protein